MQNLKQNSMKAVALLLAPLLATTAMAQSQIRPDSSGAGFCPNGLRCPIAGSAGALSGAGAIYTTQGYLTRLNAAIKYEDQMAEPLYIRMTRDESMMIDEKGKPVRPLDRRPIPKKGAIAEADDLRIVHGRLEDTPGKVDSFGHLITTSGEERFTVYYIASPEGNRMEIVKLKRLEIAKLDKKILFAKMRLNSDAVRDAQTERSAAVDLLNRASSAKSATELEALPQVLIRKSVDKATPELVTNTLNQIISGKGTIYRIERLTAAEAKIYSQKADGPRVMLAMTVLVGGFALEEYFMGGVSGSLDNFTDLNDSNPGGWTGPFTN